MNATVVLLSSLMPAADPAPAAPAAPVVVQGQGGCSNCGGGPIAYSAQARTGLLGRLKGLFNKKSACDSGPKPGPCVKPNPCPQPTLVDYIKSKTAKKAAPCGCCPPAPCTAAATAPVTAPPPGPQPMPNPMPKPKTTTETGIIIVPTPQPIAPSGPRVILSERQN